MGFSPLGEDHEKCNVFRIFWGWPRASPFGIYKLRWIVASALLV
jgi:hypothetical protein